MENIKFYAVTLLLVLAAGFLGYGAISSLRDPVYYVNNQTLATVGDIKSGANTEPAPETPSETTPTLSPETTVNPEPTTATATQPETPAQPAATNSLATNADIKSALQKIAAGAVLKKGSSGDDVKALQAALNAIAKSGLPINGSFGAQTEAAVKKFQTSAKLPSTGQVASKTIAALIAKL